MSDSPDYDVRYLQLWKDAVAKAVTIPVDTKRDAFSLRHRIYRCRMQMKDAKHDFYPLARAVSISIIETAPDGTERAVNGNEKATKPGCTYKLVMENPDAKFNESLLRAGYEIPEAPSLD